MMKKEYLFYLFLLPYILFYWELEVGRWLIVISLVALAFSHLKKYSPSLGIVITLTIYQFYALISRLFLLPGDVIRGSMEAGVGMGMFLMLVIVSTPFFILFPLDVLYKRNKKYILLLLVSLLVLLFWLFLIYLDGNSQGITSFY